MEINVVLVTGAIRMPRRTGQAESVPRCESRLLAIDLESHRQYLLGNSQLLYCCLWARIVGPNALGKTLGAFDRRFHRPRGISPLPFSLAGVKLLRLQATRGHKSAWRRIVAPALLTLEPSGARDRAKLGCWRARICALRQAKN